MTGDVSKIEVLRADKLNWWTLKHGVVFFAYITSILDGLLKDIMNVLMARW